MRVDRYYLNAVDTTTHAMINPHSSPVHPRDATRVHTDSVRIAAS